MCSVCVHACIQACRNMHVVLACAQCACMHVFKHVVHMHVVLACAQCACMHVFKHVGICM